MKQNNLSFFDADTKITYILAQDTLSTRNKTPRYVDVLCQNMSYFKHVSIEVDKSAMDNSQISSLLFSIAYQKSILDKPPYIYEIYFTTHQHLFDEQKCVCECFFYEKQISYPKTQIIICDIFLPIALSAFNVQENIIVWIESYLCYFENNMLKEVLHCQKETKQSTLDTISSHIAYLQEAYHQSFTSLYYFSDSFIDGLDSMSIDMPDTPYNTQILHIMPLEKILQDGKLTSFENFKALLALHYVSIYRNSPLKLPNFAPKPIAHKKLYVASGLMCVLFMVIVPLFFVVYNQHLYNDISALNAKNEALFLEESINDSINQDRFKKLKKKEAVLLHNMQELIAWQQSYNQRYIFIQTICKEHSFITYEYIRFHFATNIFIATVRVSADSQIHISELLAGLNTDTQSATLQDSIKESEEMPGRFYANIVVVQNAI